MRGKNDGMLPGQLAQQVPKLPDLPGVQAHSRFVQNQDFRAAHQQLRHRHPLAVALGKVPNQPVLYIQKLQPAAQRADIIPPRPAPLGQAPQLTGKQQLLRHRHVHVERRHLRQITDVPPGLQRLPRHVGAGNLHLSPGGLQIAAEQIHGGGFPGPVGAE